MNQGHSKKQLCENCASSHWVDLGDGLGQRECEDCCRKGLRNDAALSGGTEFGDGISWAPGCDPEMYTDENGDYVAKNPMYPFWQSKAGETPVIRLIQSDNIVECIDNTGMEDQFDQGIEYIFEGAAHGDMITVFDKLGEKRECFPTRFKVKSTEGQELKKHFFPMLTNIMMNAIQGG